MEGLKEKKLRDGSRAYFREGGPRNRCIAFTASSAGTLTRVRYLEDGVPPGLDPAEQVLMTAPDDNVIERVVRAMAVMHLDAIESEVASTSIDKEMITRGAQVVPLENGDTKSFGWQIMHEGFLYTITRDAHFSAHPSSDMVIYPGVAGLPVFSSDPVRLFCKGAGREVEMEVASLDMAFIIIDTDMARSLMMDPHKQTPNMVGSVFIKERVVWH